MWKNSANIKNTKKEVRKPVSGNFAPKRLAINFEPPTIILEYLVIDTGKLYHHKMRLDSVLRKLNVTRTDVLNYMKTKHHLYFVHNKIKDDQLLKFIDKILIRHGKAKPGLQKIVEKSKHLETTPSQQLEKHSNDDNQQDDDFDYLNDDEQYEQDYEDYEEEQPQSNKNLNKQNKSVPKQLPKSSFTTKQQSLPTAPPVQNKNTFMTYCQEQYDDDNQSEGQANWDLDIDENADFDFV